LPQPDAPEASRSHEGLADSQRELADLRAEDDQASRPSNDIIASLNKALNDRDQALAAERQKHAALIVELDALRTEQERRTADALKAEQERRMAEAAEQTRRTEVEEQRHSELEVVRRQRDDLESKASSQREEFELGRRQFEEQITQLARKATELEEERIALEELLHASRADLKKLTGELGEAQRDRDATQESLAKFRASEQTHFRLQEDRIFELRQAAQSRERELAAVIRERDTLQADLKRLSEQADHLQSLLEAKSIPDRSTAADLPSPGPGRASQERGVGPVASANYLVGSTSHPAASASSREAVASASNASPSTQLRAVQAVSPQARLGRTASAPAQELRSGVPTTMRTTKVSVPSRIEAEPREEYALRRPSIFRWLTILGSIALGLLVLNWVAKQMSPLRLELEGGKVIDVPHNSILTSIVPFLKARGEGESQRFTWNGVEIDRTSHTISPSSAPQIAAMATVLDAYPNAKVKIVVHLHNSGYRDKDTADATACANALRAALVDRGILARRIQTETAEPVATSSLAFIGLGRRDGETELIVSR
jgi:hypothetical protein